MRTPSIAPFPGKLLRWIFAGLLCAGGWWTDARAQTQARTPLDEFKAFLSHPPAIEELILERNILTPMPTMIGTNQAQPAGKFFQIRFQTNAYFVRQMQTMAAAQQPHSVNEPLEGLWNGEYWTVLNDQLSLYTGNQTTGRLNLTGRILYDNFLGLGLDERIIRSTIVWRGDGFTAQGKGGLRFEGRIEEKTPTGLPKRIDTWSDEDPGRHHKVDYEYRAGVHPWLPAVIKPFLKIGAGEGRMQEFYLRSVKLGATPNPPEAFSPQRYTNQNTIVMVYTNQRLHSVSRNGVPLQIVGASRWNQSGPQPPPATQTPAPPANQPGPPPLSSPSPPALGFNGWLLLPVLLVCAISAFLIDRGAGTE